MSSTRTFISKTVPTLLGVLAVWCASATDSRSQQPAPPLQSFYVQEYEVIGVKNLPSIEVERAVYPFLGPERTVDDVEKARAALEKAYRDRGYQTVSVQIPRQDARRGVVLLQVVETTVGRLRVHGSRYYDLERIKKKAPSLQEGTLPDFKKINDDIIALNRMPDLRVTPELKAGSTPGTVDIDLNVKDTAPLHGSLEVNNRYNSGTTPWRVNAALRYDNFWQLGHSVGLSYQIAPERPDDARVFSGFYLARFPNTDAVSLLLQGSKQDSDVSTLGGAAVAGRGSVLGMRLLFNDLPKKDGFYQSLSFGMDYKQFSQDITVGGAVISAPVTYYPFTLSHTASWTAEHHSTELNSSLTWHFRRLGNDNAAAFNQRRFKADDGFFYFRGDLSHTHDLPGDFELFAKVQGQMASGPLINNEQIAGGGLATVRGYLESTALGDSGVFGTLELRSPSFLKTTEGSKDNEWRVYAFAEGGRLKLREPLPQQQTTYDLASVGIGSRLRVREHFNVSADAGLPLTREGDTRVGELLVTLRFWAEF